MIETSRRAILSGLAAAIAAPAIIRTHGPLMPVRALKVLEDEYDAFPVTVEVKDFETWTRNCLRMGDKLVMHPAIADRIRHVLLTYPPASSVLDPIFGSLLPDWLGKSQPSTTNTDSVLL